MYRNPKCIIVTGQPGAGKTTLSQKLGQRLRLPIVSRDALKEGYVNTFGVAHDQLPPDTNGIVTRFFFDIVCQYLAGKVSLIIEAALQHHVWQPEMPRLLKVSNPHLIICTVDGETAARRHLHRGLSDPKREFYHGDKRVSHFRTTGETKPPAHYEIPNFNVPTTHVSTENGYSPCLDEIIQRI